jgi:hypothetical protein
LNKEGGQMPPGLLAAIKKQEVRNTAISDMQFAAFKFNCDSDRSKGVEFRQRNVTIIQRNCWERNSSIVNYHAPLFVQRSLKLYIKCFMSVWTAKKSGSRLKKILGFKFTYDI